MLKCFRCIPIRFSTNFFCPTAETIVTGYSGTPLAKKLGIKEGLRVRVTNAPSNYLELVSPIPENVLVSSSIQKDIDIWHLFSRSLSDLKYQLKESITRIRPDGMIWASWPKKSSGVATDITEDKIREVALPMRLVDVKVCAVDKTWSGLKLVVRKELRK